MCSRNVVRPSVRRPGGALEESRKTKTKSTPLKFQLLETWTHEMCVLGRCDEDKTPNRERMENLLLAGLGKWKKNSWLFILKKINETLYHVHHRGVLHNDLKANNIVLEKRKDQWNPVVIDFARHVLVLILSH